VAANFWADDRDGGVNMLTIPTRAESEPKRFWQGERLSI
jgi:hypothetical protein